ncbi:MAG: ankyrin repeat domain-containing protein [Crocosphaera sp.]
MIPFSRKDSLEKHYKILYELGKGAMGITYAAEEVNTGQKIALKVISLQKMSDGKHLELLEQEVTVLKKFNHPNIPKYIDYFQLEEDNKLYLVQQLVPGKNLNQQVEAGLRLTETEVKNKCGLVSNIRNKKNIKDKKEIIELLINHGADVNAKTKYGYTPLYVASVWDRKDIVELLINHGADVNVRTQDGFTPLHGAVIGNRKEIVELLINHGSDVNTALYYAVDSGKKEIVELLINHGADVNAKYHYGYTLLHFAVFNGNKETVELLINGGAYVNAKDNNGYTPLNYAESREIYLEIISLLKKNGAK